MILNGMILKVFFFFWIENTLRAFEDRKWVNWINKPWIVIHLQKLKKCILVPSFLWLNLIIACCHLFIENSSHMLDNSDKHHSMKGHIQRSIIFENVMLWNLVVFLFMNYEPLGYKPLCCGSHHVSCTFMCFYLK